MKRYLVSLALLVFVFNLAFSQWSQHAHPVAVKVSPFPQLRGDQIPWTHFIVGAELYLNPAMSVEQELSPIFYNLDAPSSVRSPGITTLRGIYTQTKLRFYTREQVGGTALFFSPGINFRYMDMDVLEHQFDQSTRIWDFNDFFVARREWQAEFAFGVQHIFPNRILLETSIGPNFRYVSSNQEDLTFESSRFRESRGYNEKYLPEGEIVAPNLKFNVRVGMLLGEMPTATARKPGRFKRGIVKVYPIPAVIKDYRIGYELPFHTNFSLSIQAGVHKGRRTKIHEADTTWLGRGCIEWLPASGFNVKVGPRWYLAPNEKEQGLYLENWTGFQYTQYPEYQVFMESECRDDGGWPFNPSKRIAPIRRIWSFQLNGGFQAVANQRVVIDGYAGLGLRSTRTYEYQKTPELAPNTNAPEEWIEFYEHEEFVQQLRPRVHVGFSLGWGL